MTKRKMPTQKLSDTPAELGVVGKSDANVENSFFKGVVCPMDHLALDAWILLALHHFARNRLPRARWNW